MRKGMLDTKYMDVEAIAIAAEQMTIMVLRQ